MYVWIISLLNHNPHDKTVSTPLLTIKIDYIADPNVGWIMYQIIASRTGIDLKFGPT